MSLLRPFFPQGWAALPNCLDATSGADLANDAANALYGTGESEEALAAYGASLRAWLDKKNWHNLLVVLSNISNSLAKENRLAKQERCLLLALDLTAQQDNKGEIFIARLFRFRQLSAIGRWPDAEAMWQLLDPIGRNLSRSTYVPGMAEYSYAFLRFYQGDMTEDHLTHAEQLAKAGKDRETIRHLHRLRGQWQLEQSRHALAADSLREAVRMARQVGQIETEAEALLALAKFHLNELPNPREEAERLAKAKDPDHRTLAELWLAIGDPKQAKKHALAAYKWAWADGEPYVRRYELNKTRALLEQLDTQIPNLPPYDPVKDEKLPWEDDVAAAIEKLRAEKEAQKASEKSEEDQKS